MSIQSHPGRCGRSLQGLGLSHLALPCPALPLPSIPDPTWALQKGMLTTAVAASTLWPSCHIWKASHQEDKSFSWIVTAQGRSCCCCGGLLSSAALPSAAVLHSWMPC